MKKISLTPYRLSLAKHCFLSDGRLRNQIAENYGRDKESVVLKIFDLEEIKDESDFYKVKWGDDPKPGEPRKNTTIWQATQIHNILSWYGLSNRVYGLESVGLGNKLVPAQVTELMRGEFAKEEDLVNLLSKIDEIGKKYGFSRESGKISGWDFINGKLIDPQMYAFSKDYKETVKEFYVDKGRYGKVYYQDISELGFNGGPRKSELRIKEMGLEEIDFNGKKVADIGCAGGFFTRYAIDRGAKIARGYDMADPIEAARNVANYLGYFNNEYYVTDLSKDDWRLDADIVFFLSMNFHIGIPKQVLEAKQVIFEDNGVESRKLDKLGEPWTSHFKEIKFIGRASDHGDKPIYHLSK